MYHVNLCSQKCCGWTSDLRKWDPEAGNNPSLRACLHEIPSCMMRVTLGVLGLLQKRFWRFGTDLEGSEGCRRQKCLDRGLVLGFVLRRCWKRCCPIPSQSKDCSGWASGYPSTIMQLWSTDDIKSQILIPGRKVDLQVQSLRDDRIGGFHRWVEV